MSTTTEDVIKAAASIARDVAEGRLDAAALDQAVADECRELFGTVTGPADALWPLQLDVCRQMLAAGALSANELSEWLAVARSRAGEPVSAPTVSDGRVPTESATSWPLIADIAVVEPELRGDERELERSTDEDPEPIATALSSDCGSGRSSTMVSTADGRRIPRRLIIARGRGLPDPGVLG
jgi:hypothetical protein